MIEMVSGVAFTLLLLLVVLFTSCVLRAWRQDLAVVEAQVRRQTALLRHFQARQRSAE